MKNIIIRLGCDMPERFIPQPRIRSIINDVISRFPRWGFWLTYKTLRRRGFCWNHKRVYRVYFKLGLNQKRRARKRIPPRVRQPLFVPERPNQVWSADFMSDSLYAGKRFRTFNDLDNFNREILAIEIDTSLTSRRIIRVLGRFKEQR